ncbi:MAG: hypothetical protein Q4A52_06005 [Bacillota bacterium]|nr:hypothetical protein [Bacillota bacterium]
MKSNSGFGWIIGLIIFFFFFRFILGGLFVFAFVGFIIWSIIKAAKKGEKRVKVRMSRVLGNEEVRRLNKGLATFFETHDRLRIREDVYLRPAGAHFTDIDELYLFFGDEAVSTFGDVGQSHRSDYRQIVTELEQLFALGKQDFSSETSASDFIPAAKPQPQKEEIATTRAEQFIMEIDQLNDNIPDEAISRGLDETVRLLRPLSFVEKNLTSHSVKLDKLYEYYLPILTSILRKYDDLSRRDFGSVDFVEQKEKLTKTISLINEALRNINQSFSEGALLDMSTDIYTLQTILKKDGMVGDSMSKYTNKAANPPAAQQDAVSTATTSSIPTVETSMDELEQELEDDELIEKPESLLGQR